MSGLLVACCQAQLAVGDVAANREALDAQIREAAKRGARVVVVPELAASGYVFVDAAEVAALAESVDGPTVSAWGALARELGIVLVGGFAEKGDDALHNSAVLIDRGEVAAVYRKAHLWDRESLWFAPGDEPPPVVDTSSGRIGVMICYDLEFPEWVRLAALNGAQLLCAPTNWPRMPRPAGERPAEVVRVQADAAVNRVFIAVADRVGPERGTEWVGGSVIVDADGFPVAGPLDDLQAAVIVADCRLEDACDKRVGPRNDVHADRRPELYRSRAVLGAGR